MFKGVTRYLLVGFGLFMASFQLYATETQWSEAYFDHELRALYQNMVLQEGILSKNEYASSLFEFKLNQIKTDVVNHIQHKDTRNRLLARQHYLERMFLSSSQGLVHQLDLGQKAAQFSGLSVADSCESAVDLPSNGLDGFVQRDEAEFGQEEVWYRVRYTEATVVEISTSGSEIDTALSIYEHCSNARPISSNDDFWGFSSSAAFKAEAGKHYWIKVAFDKGEHGRLLVRGNVISQPLLLRPNYRSLQEASVRLLHFWTPDGLYMGSRSVTDNVNQELYVGNNWRISHSQLTSFLADNQVGGAHCSAEECMLVSQLFHGNAPGEALSLNAEALNVGSNVISGTIRAEGSGVLLENVPVRLIDDQGFFSGVELTDGSGRYRFENVRDGQYYLYASHNGFERQVFDGVHCGFQDSDECAFASGNIIQISSSSQQTDINFNLRRALRLSGNVRGIAGEVQTTARIHLYDASGMKLSDHIVDGAGHFNITVFPQETYFIVVSYSDSSGVRTQYPGIPCSVDLCTTESSAAIVVRDNDISDLDVVTDTYGRASGLLLDRESGELISGEVTLYTEAGEPLFRYSVTPDGKWQSQGHNEDGVYIVGTSRKYVDSAYDGHDCLLSICDFSSAALVELELNSTADNVDVKLGKKPKITGSIRGKDQSPLSRPLNLLAFNTSNELTAVAAVRLSGNYELYIEAGLPQYLMGSAYQVLSVLYNDQVCRPDCDTDAAELFELSVGDEAQGINFVLQPEEIEHYLLHGHINISGADEALRAAFDIVDLTTGHVVFSGNTDLDGFFEASMEPGSYQLFTRDERLHESASEPFSVGAVEENLVTLQSRAFPTMSGFVAADPYLVFVLSLFDEGGEIYGQYRVNGGDYRIRYVPPGQYYLRINRSGYAPEVYPNIDCMQQDCSPFSGTPINVNEDVGISDVDFSPQKLSVIQGNIFPGREYAPSRQFVTRLRQINGETFSFSSDVNEYIFRNLFPGEYTLSFAAEGYVQELYDDIVCVGPSCNGDDATIVSLGFNQTVEINPELETIGSIFGSVRSEENNLPIPNARVSLYDASGGRRLTYVDTDENGQYRFPVYEERSYKLLTHAFGFTSEVHFDIPCVQCDISLGASVHVGESNDYTAEVNFELTSSGGNGSLVGIFTDVAVTNSSDVRYSIEVYDENLNLVREVESGIFFEIEDLDPGYYYLRAHGVNHPGSLFGGVNCPQSIDIINCDLMSASRVLVNGTIHSGLRFSLLNSDHGAISGTLDWINDAPPRPGGFFIVLYDEDLQPLFSLRPSPYDGSYHISSVPNGRYFALAASEGVTFFHEIYNGIYCSEVRFSSCDFTNATVLQVNDGEVLGGIDFKQREYPRIIPRVIDKRSGEIVVVDYEAELYNLDGTLVGPSSRRVKPGTSYILKVSGGSGDYLFDTVHAGINCSDSLPEPCDITSGQVIEVGVDDKSIDVFVEPLGVIRGRVFDDRSGAPLRDGLVTLYNAAGDLLLEAEPNHRGEYQFDHLLPGDYYLAATGFSGYTDQFYADFLCYDGSSCEPTQGHVVSLDHYDVFTAYFDLTTGASIVGNVINSDSRQGAPVVLQLMNEDGVVIQESNGFNYSFSGLGAGSYYLFATGDNYYSALYPRGACETNNPQSCDFSEAQLIMLTSNETLVLDDFELNDHPQLTLKVNDRLSGDRINSSVILYDDNGAEITRRSIPSFGSGSSIYVEPNRSYYLSTQLHYTGLRNHFPYAPVIYPEVDCANPFNGSCSVTDGSLLAVGVDDIEINLSQKPFPVVSVNFVDEITGHRVLSNKAFMYSSSGEFLAEFPFGDGNIILPFDDSRYFTFLINAYTDAGLPSAMCVGTELNQCTEGVLAPISSNEYAGQSIVLPVRSFGAINGIAIDGSTQLGVPGVAIDVWQQGNLVESVGTNASGLFSARLSAGDYQISTANDYGFVDEIFNDIRCETGAPFDGFCDTTQGDLIHLSGNDTGDIPPLYKVELFPPDVINMNGFE